MKQVNLRSYEYDGAQALHLQSPSVRISPSRFPRQIRLEFIHVKQLKRETTMRHVAFRDIKGKVQLRHLMASIFQERERERDIKVYYR